MTVQITARSLVSWTQQLASVPAAHSCLYDHVGAHDKAQALARYHKNLKFPAPNLSACLMAAPNELTRVQSPATAAAVP